MGALPTDAYDELIASTTQLNRIGATLAKDDAVHAITDVTGFGLLGHALEMARGSAVTLCVDADSPAAFRHAAALVRQGFVTGASGRNWASYGASVDLPAGFADWRQNLLTDPQTSGGLLVSCAEAEADRLVSEIVSAGYEATRRIGRVEFRRPKGEGPSGERLMLNFGRRRGSRDVKIGRQCLQVEARWPGRAEPKDQGNLPDAGASATLNTIARAE